MLVLLDIPCEVEESRSKLSHDWLGNKVQRLTAKKVARMHAEPSATRAEFESRLLPNGLYDEQVRCLHTLIETMVEGYSPIQLVGTGPLSRLPEPIQSVVKETVHELYLQTPLHEADRIESLQVKLREAAEAFSSTLERFRSAWFREPPASAIEVKSAFQDVLDQASALRQTLDYLPRGIVLP